MFIEGGGRQTVGLIAIVGRLALFIGPLNTFYVEKTFGGTELEGGVK